MSIYKNGKLIAGGRQCMPLLSFMWADHQLNDISWLRADTFSWQNGAVYQAVYQHLVDDIGEPQTYYAWGKYSGVTNVRVFTTTLNPQVGDTAWVFSFDSTRTSFDINNAEVVTIINSGTGTPPIVYIDNGNFYAIGRNDVAPTELSRMSSDDITPNLNSETISGTTIQYYLAADGHKLVLPDQESNVAAIYNATGVAWYYVLDTTNQRFKLPRTKYGVTGLRDTVGNYVPETLPNVWYSNGGFTSDPTIDGALTQKVRYNVLQNETSSSTRFIAQCSFSATNCSDTYQNNAPVQERATQMYLYFYVGQFTQTALENTAGLNAELFNDKADNDLSNLTTGGKKTCAALGMPSDTWDDVTVGASGATYTAPANGYFAFRNGAQTYLSIKNLNSTAIENEQMATWLTTSGNSGFLPVKKGQTIQLNYSASSFQYFRFIYAQGEV